MVNFLFIQEKTIDYNKSIIDKGLTPQKIYKICSCIRETFCLSYSIRKNNCLYLFFLKENVLIKFEGKILRYLGPDERSQALLLEKVLQKVKREHTIENEQWIKSTPGIFVRKFLEISSFLDFYRSIALGRSFLIINNRQTEEVKVDIFNLSGSIKDIEDDDFFIIPFYSLSEEDSQLIRIFKKVKNLNYLSFSKIKEEEDLILYINFKKDQQRR